MLIEKKCLLICSVAFSIVAATVGPAFAASDEAVRDIKFCQLLNDMGMQTFSERFLEVRLAENPADSDSYNIQQADNLLSQNRYDDAKKLIDKVPKNSPEYYDGAGALGVYYFQKGERDKALQYLEPMYDFYKKNNAKPEEHERPLAALLNLYYQTGKDDKAQELLEWTQGGESDRRAALYTKIMIRLETALRLRKGEEREMSLFEHRLSVEKKDKKKQSELSSLSKKMDDLTKRIARKQGDYNTNVKDLQAVYKRLSELLDLDMTEVSKIQGKQADRDSRAVKLKNRSQISKNELEGLKKYDKDDWNSMVASACLEFLSMEWGGQNIMTAYASSQVAHCFYLLGLYDDAVAEVTKYSDLFDAADAAMNEMKRLSESPSADAKYWAGKSNKALGDAAYDAGTSEKKAQAVTYYKRAFKYLGKLTKYYTDFREITEAYDDFSVVTDRLCELDPSKRNTYQKEFNGVKKPTNQPKQRLVSAWAQQNFESKMYDVVIEELLAVLQENASSRHDDMTELLNRLILSYAYTGDTTRAAIYGHYIANLDKLDENVSVALANAGHLAWEKAMDENTDPAVAEQAKEDALNLYRYFLDVDKVNPSAGLIALRVARERFNQISRIGEALNAATVQSTRVKLKAEWQNAIHEAIAAYEFISANFGSNSALVDEAYLRCADCQMLLDDHKKAVDMLKNYLSGTSTNLAVSAVAKENISELLSKQGAKVKAQAEEILDLGEPGAEDKAEKLKADSVALYQESIDNLLEFMNESGTKYASVANDDMFKKTKTRADALLPWLYDGAGNREKAISEFRNFVEKHPKDSLAPAYLMRVGVIQIELHQQEDAQTTLSDLIAKYPNSNEAKNARYFLARNLFESGNAASAISIFNTIFNSKPDLANLTIGNLRWLAEKLPTCKEPSQVKDASTLALKVAELLLQKISAPELTEWFSPERAEELSADKEKLNKVMSSLEQKILLDAGRAAAGMGDFDKAVNYITRIELVEPNTPYYFDLHFALSDVYAMQGKNDVARGELAKISTRANQLNDYGIYDKAQVLTGESYLKDNAVNKANVCFSIVALSVSEESDNTDTVAEEYQKYVEQAVYRYAYTLSLLGQNEERDEMVSLYKKRWPDGRYAKDLETLPASQAQ